MKDQRNIGSKQASTSKRSGCLMRLGAGLGYLLGLLLVGYVYERIVEAADAREFPLPGRLVDVGGYRLHLNCSGTGSPTVVIEAGLGDWSTGWAAVQQAVSGTTQVCTYDRAGWGWSDPGTTPRDAAQFAKDLHTLLHNAGIPGPYLMVGHSLGGFGVRVFVSEYAAEVAGVVLIDSMSPRQFSQADLATQSQPESQPQSFSLPALLARFGIVRLIARPLGIMPDVPTDEGAYFARLVLPNSAQALANESGSLPASAAEAAAVESFGDLPLIVLTAELNDIEGWREWQAELLQLSSISQHLFAETGHNVHFEDPDTAAAAILQMVEQVR